MARPTHQEQMAQAEELLGDRLARAGFAKGLYFGHYLADRFVPYPDPGADPQVNQLVEQLHRFCLEQIDPVQIDRQADIPAEVIRGLGRLGVLGACMPRDCGGLELSQTGYCRLLETLGGWCSSTALFVNAHHSIGPRAIVLFGTPEQKRRWLPSLARGETISAFALTEPEAGSDAANVQTTATPSEDGRGYVLNGQKRYITNGAIAGVLTVMARTPDPRDPRGKVTAFLVTPEMPGFEVTEARMPKCGVRGTVTSRLAFRNMFVPRENVLGPLGRGLKIALTVLDFGRVTFGATCTGAARFCVEHVLRHAATRRQFGRTLGEFELVKEKLAWMAAHLYAMEATTYQTAALIDSGSDDYMIETAMLKVFATEALWRIINDTIQLYGGAAYFSHLPFERMMRDARINSIGEGANDVLRVFVALAGMRDVGLELEGVLRGLRHPIGSLPFLAAFAGRQLQLRLLAPEVPVRSTLLEGHARDLGRAIRRLALEVQWLLRTYQEEVLERQYHLARVADAATWIYASACVLRRLDWQLAQSDPLAEEAARRDVEAGRYFLRLAGHAVAARLDQIHRNLDQHATQVADQWLRHPPGPRWPLRDTSSDASR